MKSNNSPNKKSCKACIETLDYFRLDRRTEAVDMDKKTFNKALNKLILERFQLAKNLSKK